MFRKEGNSNTVKEVMQARFSNFETFLKPAPYPAIINLENAVAFFKEKVEQGQTVTIVGDYDYDGICSTAILTKALRLYGIEPKMRLPKRFSEGYGLSEKIIDEIPSGLIITVDNGIAASAAIKKAKEKGISTIIIDHHLPPVNKEGQNVLPPADVLVDPWAYSDSEYTEYCGAGLAYRFAEELLPKTDLGDLKVLASIATITDVMNLWGANRILVREGLSLINKGRLVPGLRQLLKKLQLDTHITENDYAFTIGPIFNAPGRLYDNGAAEYALDILTADFRDYKLPWKCGKLIDINEERKAKVKEALKKLDLNSYPADKGIVLYDPYWGEGIIGLIAGKVCEKKGTPVIVFTKTASGVLKGSGRSTPDIHLKKILDKISEDILGYGGHKGAAGLSIKEEDLEKFTYDFQNLTEHEIKSDDISYDLELPFDLSFTIEELKKYAPYGQGNKRIRFHFFYHVDKVEALGDDGTHIRFSKKDESVELIGFDMYHPYLSMGAPEVIEAVGYLSEQWFNGRMKYQIELIYFEPYNC